MTKKFSRVTDAAGLIASVALTVALAGCISSPPSPQVGYPQPRPNLQVQASIVMDDYDYYPGYEVYYSRNRREYVYLEGRTWVRRPAPQGVTISALFASPSVRMEFRDAPEQHHATVVRSYPRNWMSPEMLRAQQAAADQARIQEQYRERQAVAVQVAIADDYDYYPGYEVYYSRNRQEYVYLEGRNWVRRPAPQGISVAALFASPSVRMDFRDSPEQHHNAVVRSYPRNWMPEPARIRAEQAAADQARTREPGRERPGVAVQVTIVDDYDYFPGYEVYYSRNRNEYVYLEGNSWVRRPAPRGVTVATLAASPSVRMDFQDAPEHHHGNVVKSYPKNWSPPGRGRGNRNREDRDERKDDKDDQKPRERN